MIDQDPHAFELAELAQRRVTSADPSKLIYYGGGQSTLGAVLWLACGAVYFFVGAFERQPNSWFAGMPNIALGVLYAVVSIGLIFGRTTVVIDARAGEVRRAWGLPFQLSLFFRRYAMTGDESASVALAEGPTANGNRAPVTCYEVKLHVARAPAILLYRTRNPVAARLEAEKVNAWLDQWRPAPAPPPPPAPVG